jgi:hypothetical protein
VGELVVGDYLLEEAEHEAYGPSQRRQREEHVEEGGRRSLRSRWAKQSPRKTATIRAACMSPRTTSAAPKTHKATRRTRRTGRYSGKRTKVLSTYPKEPSLFTGVLRRSVFSDVDVGHPSGGSYPLLGKRCSHPRLIYYDG